MDKSNYSFYSGKPEVLNASDLQQGTYLWVLHADKIPPHVGISHYGFYYSLKAHGKDENLPVAQVLQVLNRKKTPSMFFQLSDEIKPDLAAAFAAYKQIVLHKSTCLSPITAVLLAEEQDLILAELLEKLEKQERIQSIFGLHLEADFLGIPQYDRAEIAKRISKIQDAKRSQHIFKSH